MEKLEKRLCLGEVEQCDADASLTYNQQAGTIHKGDYIMLKKMPCKVDAVATFQNGKHGKTKCHFKGTDIFTGKKYEELLISGHNASVPIVTRTEYQIVSISEDGYCFLMGLKAPYKTRADIKCPDADFSTRVKALIADEEKDVCAIVIGACDKEMILDTKILAS